MGVRCSLHAARRRLVARARRRRRQPRPYVVVYDTPPGSPFPVQAETAARERAYGFRAGRASATRSTASRRG